MEGRRSGWRIVHEARHDLIRTVQILFGRGRPVNLGMQQRGQPLPTAVFDRVEHGAYKLGPGLPWVVILLHVIEMRTQADLKTVAVDADWWIMTD